MTQHLVFMKTFSNRLRNVRKLKSLWKRRCNKDFFDELQHSSEKTITTLLMGSVLFRIEKKLFSMQFCSCLLESVEVLLLKSNDHKSIQLGLEFCAYVIKAFSQAIHRMLCSQDINCEDDITMLDRKQNCQHCLTVLQSLKPELSLLAGSTNQDISSQASNCLESLQQFDQHDD